MVALAPQRSVSLTTTLKRVLFAAEHADAAVAELLEAGDRDGEDTSLVEEAITWFEAFFGHLCGFA